MDFKNFKIPYGVNEKYTKKVAYFSMEFAIEQVLKIYSGGLGFLAGSHMRSAYNLKQDLVGIGILWKFGYYDQARNHDQTLQPTWTRKMYSFLEDTGIKFQIEIHSAPVWVKVYYLDPEIFHTAPMFFLSTDVSENDHVSKTICHKLYDANESTKLAQYILLGKGGAKLLDEMNLEREVYHLNEAHGLPAAFHLLKKFNGNLQKVKEKLVFTTHTPEEAGNEKHNLRLCYDMSYFSGLSMEEAKKLEGSDGELFNHSLCALKMARIANGVSQLHGVVSRAMWSKYPGICEIKSITNAQEFKYWGDKELYIAKDENNDTIFDYRKKLLKKRLFKIVADQTGNLFDPNIFTIVWARRFAGYKRADLLLHDKDRFIKLLNNPKYPVQIIWAGKPYPMDYSSISTFNTLVEESKNHKNMAVLTGYELSLSKSLKQGSDLWLNNPRVPREASGTSGMSAAMNGSVNLSTDDGWIPEFAKHGENSFVVPKCDYENMSIYEQDNYDLNKLYEILEEEILPLYYDQPKDWRKVQQNAMNDVKDQFNSDRMADEYYEIMYKQNK
ncbi:alpha-glucan family phosphorylase [Chryseobacterium wangxinyae]|uniref:alpha-glucan family phosphorylase n=1 Tax=unclassified Chryseobacterium TaxID=2593645 RepID=UPI00226E2F39|nr:MULTISPECIES: alpha-glucan family phosphorylase [unclassified Chryseobacterium]MCY0967582.1 alpha-glucan family phosphorylase [Chryseobacterium sp. CY353]MCY0977934.1 alpha-glucan family phosphorylase [Chryseobacterium sp. CY350]WBZ95022.1 alpha-glucan family phosphorylase [Chryseobacterium sp. CY350]